MKRIEFVGNVVGKIDNILRNNLKATKTDFFSNNIDEGYHIYKVEKEKKEIEVEVHIKEDTLFGDVTTISSIDNNIIGEINTFIQEKEQ